MPERITDNIRLFIHILVLFALAFSDISFAQKQNTEDVGKAKKIVCLLPITGTYSVLGNMALRGVLAAKETSGMGDYEIEVIDTGVTEPGSALLKILGQPNISFIVGPVPGSEFSRVAPVIKKIHIPVLVFPVLRDDNLISHNLVRYTYPVEMQSEELVDFLSGNKRVSKFAILHPDTEMGRKFRESYQKSLMKNGRSLTYSGSYDPNNLDISSEIQWIETLNPDAIFIPDGASRSSIIIKKVVANRRLFNTFFLGPGTWNSEAFKRDLDSKIDGIIYKTLFTDFIDTKSEEWAQFKQIYRELFGDDPGSFEYRVYDATTLLMSAQRLSGKLAEKIKKVNADDRSGEYHIDTSVKGIDVYPRPMIFTLDNNEIKRVK